MHYHFFKDIAKTASKGSKEIPQVIAEIEWLIQQGIIFEPEESITDKRIASSDEFKNFANIAAPEVPKILEAQKLKREELFKIDKEQKTLKIMPAMQQALEAFNSVLSLNARYFATQLRVLNNMDAYPVFSNFITPSGDTGSKKNDVIQIVLKNLPMPDDSTPLGANN